MTGSTLRHARAFRRLFREMLAAFFSRDALAVSAAERPASHGGADGPMLGNIMRSFTPPRRDAACT